MQEVWKDILGYEDLYQVSNFGRIKSKYYNKIIQPIHNMGGYCVRQLTKDGKRKGFSVHRLVAEHFIPNPNNYSQVNHIDCDKDNNHVSNLEWCTAKHNCEHRTANGLSKGGAPRGNKNASKT